MALCIESFFHKLGRRRCFAEDMRMETKLKRCLSFTHLLLFALSYMVGSGIFVLNGRLIKDVAGSAAVFSYPLAAISAFTTSACYAEFATMIPRAGSSYIYTYLTIGEFPAFLIGWTTIADVIVATAVAAKAFSGTIDWLTGNEITNWANTTLVTLNENSFTEPRTDLLAGGFLIFLVAMNMFGVKLSIIFLSVFSVLQLIGLVIVIIASFIVGSPQNLVNDGGFFPFGVEGIFTAAGLAVFAVSGMDIICNCSEEAVNPQKDIPRTLGVSIVIVLLLYCPASLSLSYLIPRHSIVYESPYVAAFAMLDQTGLKWVAAAATLLASSVTKLSAIYAIPRAFYALAKDGLLPHCFGHVCKCNGQPIFSLVFAGILTILLAMFFRIQILADFMTIGTIFCYFIIGLDLIVFRYLLSSPSEGSAAEKPLEHLMRMRKTSWLLDQLRFRWVFQTLLGTMITSIIVFVFVLRVCLWLKMVSLWVLLAVVGIILVTSFILISMYEPQHREHVFETNCMPLVPFITMFANALLLTTLSWVTWIRFVLWLVLGLIVYFSYGIWHSKAEEEKEKEYLKLMDVSTIK